MGCVSLLNDDTTVSIPPKVLVRLRNDPVGIAFPLANWPGSWYTWQAGGHGFHGVGIVRVGSYRYWL